MKPLLVVPLLLAFPVLTARAGELVFPVDLLALGAVGTGTAADGWTATGLSNYSADSHYALRFNRNDSRADSPVYPAPVTAIDLTAFSSSSNNLTRQLVVIAHPRHPLPAATNLVYRCAVTATTSRPLAQIVVWEPELDIRSFSLAVESKPSARTNWGVVKLTVHTQKPPGLTLCVR